MGQFWRELEGLGGLSNSHPGRGRTSATGFTAVPDAAGQPTGCLRNEAATPHHSGGSDEHHARARVVLAPIATRGTCGGGPCGPCWDHARCPAGAHVHHPRPLRVFGDTDICGPEE